MTGYKHVIASVLGAVAFCGADASLAASDYKVVTIISSDTLNAAREAAPEDRVSDQPIKHVESAEGNLGIGVVHRPGRSGQYSITSSQRSTASWVDRAPS